MSESFVLDYYLLVSAASCGLYQMAAACNRLRGLMLFESKRLTFIFGLVLWVGAFAWFFLSEPRNMPDTGAGLTGNEQFGYFFAGGGTGLAVTLAATSLRNWRLGKDMETLPTGLDALRDAGYARALFQGLMPLLRPLPEDRRASLAALRQRFKGVRMERTDHGYSPTGTPGTMTRPGEGDG